MHKQAATLDPAERKRLLHRRAAHLPGAQPGDLLRGPARLRRDEPPRPPRRARAHDAAGALGGRRAVGRARRALIAHDALPSPAPRRHLPPRAGGVVGRLRRHAPRARRRRADDAGVRREPGGDRTRAARGAPRSAARLAVGGLDRRGSAARLRHLGALSAAGVRAGRRARREHGAPGVRVAAPGARAGAAARRSSRRRVHARSPLARFARSRCSSCRCRRLSDRSCSSSSRSERRGCPRAG